MSTGPSAESLNELTVRSYEPRDLSTVLELYNKGLIFGQVAPNDSGADLDHIQEAYFDDPRHHFWVAEQDGQVVGMIGVGTDEEHTAEIRRLRVAPELQNTGIPPELLSTAIAHCRHHNFLKVRLDTSFEKEEALDLFDKVGFQHTRTRNLHGKDLLEFYLDLYRDVNDESERA